MQARMQTLIRSNSPVENLQPVRVGVLAAWALASSVLLSGCSIWPKALTFGTSQEPAPAPTQTAAPAPATAEASPAAVAPAAPSPAVPTPLAPTAAVTPTPLADAPKEPAPAPMQAMPAAPAQTPEAHASKNKKGAKATKATTAKTAKTHDLVPGFYINVGLFGVPENGTKAFKKLEAAGLPVFSDGIKTKKGNLTRVRVGPFPTQAEADAAATQIQALKLDAVVFKH